jgi:uncharacterized small protein (DUF1192 family)
MPTLLQIRKEAEAIEQLYAKNPRTNTYNAIIFGKVKLGKTYLLKTCRKPVFVHSFDPGGSVTLRKEIESGEILVDTSFEVEDPYNPKAFALWEHRFNKLVTSGFFNHVGTFSIDSMTTWAQCIMNEVIKQAAKKQPSKRKVGQHPHRDDWLPQMQFIESYMRKFVSLPCDCVLLGHEDQPMEEDGTPKGDLGLLITGKLKTRVPALFDEIYRLEMDNYKKQERRLRTRPAYGILAGSRLSAVGNFEEFEPADIKALMKKAGLPHEDKPLFRDLKDEEEN